MASETVVPQPAHTALTERRLSAAEWGPERAYGIEPGSLLDVFNQAGVISAGDVHVASVIARLGGGGSDEVKLAVALAARAPRMGHVLVDLAQVESTTVPDVTSNTGEIEIAALPWPGLVPWVAQLRESGLCQIGEADGEEPVPARPLRLVGECLYLERYWQDETLVAREVLARACRGPEHRSGFDVQEAIERLFPGQAPAPGRAMGAQAVAAARAMTNAFSVISGGPGTGKTTTVARFLALVFEEAFASAALGSPAQSSPAQSSPAQPSPAQSSPAQPSQAQPSPAQPSPAQSVALAAPTGKAAARMAEAVHKEAMRADISPQVRAALMSLQASTVHRLLGRAPGRQDRFRHGRDNRLPHDVVVVDETSMMSLPLMARLLEAVRPTARLVLVGDHEQLASVEAGAVLADLVGPVAREQAVPEPSLLSRGITVLTENHRFAGPLAELAAHVRAGRSAEALAMLSAGLASRSPTAGTPTAGLASAGPATEGSPAGEGRLLAGDLAWLPTPGVAPIAATAVPGRLAAPASASSAWSALKSAIVAAGVELVEAGVAGDAEAGLRALERWRLLCAHRDGPAGVSTWNEQVERWLAAAGHVVAPAGWYAGRPVVVTENDYSLGLFNGDSGFTVKRPDGGLSVAFRRGQDLEMLSPARLARVQTAFAMTAHRAQGSEFDRVCVMLPDAPARILSRELLYTALTRARTGVVVVATEDALAGAIGRPVARASRLTERTWGAPSPSSASPATVPGDGTYHTPRDEPLA